LHTMDNKEKAYIKKYQDIRKQLERLEKSTGYQEIHVEARPEKFGKPIYIQITFDNGDDHKELSKRLQIILQNYFLHPCNESDWAYDSEICKLKEGTWKKEFHELSKVFFAPNSSELEKIIEYLTTKKHRYPKSFEKAEKKQLEIRG